MPDVEMDFKGSPQNFYNPYNLAIITNHDRMTIAKANNDKWRYWVYFEAAFQLACIYFSATLKQHTEERFIEMGNKIAEIENGPLNEHAKKQAIDDLRYDFANEFKLYIPKAMTRSGLVHVSDEGNIDLARVDATTLAHIIRGKYSVKKEIEELEKNMKENEIKLAEMKEKEAKCIAEKSTAEQVIITEEAEGQEQNMLEKEVV